MQNNEILSFLNPAQRQAVEYCDGPSLVIAGAGSGKTRVLTYKIAYLMQNGVEPWSILALTFTNKAAREMRERIGRLVGEHEASMLWMGTFHSIFARILRYESESIGFTSHYTIYDDKDSASLIKTIIREMGLDEKQYRPGAVAHRISEAKNELITPSLYVQDMSLMRRDQMTRMSRIHEIYSTYQNRLRQSDAMDFDDLLLNTYLLLKSNPEIRRKYEERFHFVLVDEYQDTNYAQHQIVWLLTEHRQRVCVVGDDAQSIYSFRGARIDNILSFRNAYQGAQLFKLEQNYRSTQTIVGAANSVIKNNRRQIQKDVFSQKEVGEAIEVVEAYSDKEEAAIVARKILELRQHCGFDYGDVAILYRTNDQSRIFEEEFMRRKYPYRIYGGLSFYQRTEVKDSLAYLRLAVNPHDEEALRRVINKPARGIGNTTMERVYTCAIEHGVTPFEVISNPVQYSLPVNAATQGRLVRFADFISECNRAASTEEASTLAVRILNESGLVDSINAGREPEDRERQANLQELLNSITSFVEDNREEGRATLLPDFLQTVVLLTDADKQLPQDGQTITLMTVHAAKGLEFRAVFVVGLEEDLFPSEMAQEEGNVEEERRLFYVAVTRAEERLFLTWSHSRMRYGKFQNNQCSRFLREVPAKYLSSQKREGSLLFGSSRPAMPSRTEVQRPVPSQRPLRPVRQVQSSFTAAAPLPSGQQVSVGAHVEHARFGRGVVTAIEGSGMDVKATVDFENSGRKQLLLRFARLQVIAG